MCPSLAIPITICFLYWAEVVKFCMYVVIELLQDAMFEQSSDAAYVFMLVANMQGDTL